MKLTDREPQLQQHNHLMLTVLFSWFVNTVREV